MAKRRKVTLTFTSTEPPPMSAEERERRIGQILDSFATLTLKSLTKKYEKEGGVRPTMELAKQAVIYWAKHKKDPPTSVT